MSPAATAIPASADPACSDEALALRARAGEEAAFTELYHRHRAAITGYAWRMLGRREEAEEVCTETFVRLLQAPWRPEGSVRAYLFTVAHRQCLDLLRKVQRRSRLLPRLAESAAEPASPEAALVADERQAGLERAIAALPAEHRATLLLYYTQGLPSREVARVLGCDDQQVRSRLAYARRRLRELLTAEEEHHA